MDAKKVHELWKTLELYDIREIADERLQKTISELQSKGYEVKEHGGSLYVREAPAPEYELLEDYVLDPIWHRIHLSTFTKLGADYIITNLWRGTKYKEVKNGDGSVTMIKEDDRYGAPTELDDGILPIVKNVAAKTIDMDLVSVKPMSLPKNLHTYTDFLYKDKDEDE